LPAGLAESPPLRCPGPLIAGTSVDLLRNRYGDMDKMGASQIAVVIAVIIGYNSQIAFCAGRLRRSVG
jgi:hypothetical protein